MRSADRSVPLRVCFYCGASVTRGEYDHFPIPKSAGGTQTVFACLACHDLKDRYPFVNWPTELWIEVTKDFPKLNRETRLFLAKAIRLFYEFGGDLQ